MTEKLIIDMDSDLKYRLKVHAVKVKKTIKEVVSDAVENVLHREDEEKKERL